MWKLYVDKGTNKKELFQTNNICKQRKSLNENGTIYEDICVSVNCIKNGAPCKPFGEHKHLHFSVQCKDVLPTPKLIEVNGTKEKIMEPVVLHFKSGNNRSVCCKNETNYVQYFGDGCAKINKIEDIICNFTPHFALYPCSTTNFQNVSQYCS